jgi:BirA family biotin operon repressor/biotin-[acetyl-CoA-carboxylase] ligase
LFNILTYDTVTSTMDVAAELLASQGSAALETIIVAKQQDGGRGRAGRQWISPPGNLYVSFITRDVQPAQLSPFALMWGVILQKSLAMYTDAHVQCKWPNDVLVNDKKVGGILIEREHNALIVGIGVNLISVPECVQFPATAMNLHTSKPIDINELVESISSLYTYSRKLFEEDFEAIRQSWLNSAWKLHEEINIRQERGSVVGIFETIDETGALILAQASGSKRKLYVGDLFGESRNATNH